MCETRKEGTIKTKSVTTSVAMLSNKINGMLSSIGAVVT